MNIKSLFHARDSRLPDDRNFQFSHNGKCMRRVDIHFHSLGSLLRDGEEGDVSEPDECELRGLLIDERIFCSEGIVTDKGCVARIAEVSHYSESVFEL